MFAFYLTYAIRFTLILFDARTSLAYARGLVLLTEIKTTHHAVTVRERRGFKLHDTSIVDGTVNSKAHPADV